jgi:hypothetical protein
MKKTITIEFDGCICRHPYDPDHSGKAEGPPVPGAMAFIVEALERYRVVVCSPRAVNQGGIGAMWDYLRDIMAEHYAGQMRQAWPEGLENVISRAAYSKATDAVSRIDFSKVRVVAHLNIDPRAFRFVGVWPSMNAIEAFSDEAYRP